MSKPTDQIRVIDIKSDYYPASLKKIAKPPPLLYLRGQPLSSKEICFAIVGTRRCSLYGRQAAAEISGDLSEAGITVVSGLALGIDSAAHQAAVNRKKRTVAVLGTGLDDASIYPRQNLGLARRILENNGALISELPPRTPGWKANFPARNRIISGLCLGTLVVEAGQKSGALITARWAKQQGRKVFALPGSIYSLNSKGSHALIKQGALLAENSGDIISGLGLKNINLRRGKIVKGETAEENLILAIARERPLHIDEIIRKSGLPASKVCSILAMMEIDKKVKNMGGNVYSINR
jgi:DNA processing protein